MFGVFRVKNHDFTQKNHIFSNFREGGGARPPAAPPLDPPLHYKLFMPYPCLLARLSKHFAFFKIALL